MSFANHRDTDQSSFELKTSVGVDVTENETETENPQPDGKLSDGEYRLAAPRKYLWWVACMRFVTLGLLIV